MQSVDIQQDVDTHRSEDGQKIDQNSKMAANHEIEEENEERKTEVPSSPDTKKQVQEDQPLDEPKKNFSEQLIEQAQAKILKEKLANVAASDTVAYGKILLTYANGTDKILMAFGYFFAIVTGLGIPSFTYLFGDVINDFGGKESITDVINPLALTMTIIGGVMFVTSYIYFVFLVIMAERIGKKTRVAYLRSILQQDISWFDSSVNITELSALLSKEC